MESQKVVPVLRERRVKAIDLSADYRLRNANDYTGQPITPGVVSECLTQAKALRKALLSHLSSQHPDLLKTRP